MKHPKTPIAQTPSDWQASEVSRPTLTEPAPDQEADDRSIEEYMTALLERVSASSRRAADTDAGAGNRARSRRQTTSSPTESLPSHGNAAGRALHELPVGPIMPRTAPPESSETIRSMRELAKLHAHTAVSTHSLAGVVARAYGKLVSAVAAMLVAVALLVFIGVDRYHSLAAFVLAMALGAAWGVQFVLLARRLLKERRHIAELGKDNQQSQ